MNPSYNAGLPHSFQGGASPNVPVFRGTDDLAGFWHHYVTTTSAHTHAYRHPLFKRRTKTGL